MVPRTVAVVLTLAALAAGFLAANFSSFAATSSVEQSTYIEQPGAWVPMTVEYAIVGASRFVVREARRTDGSTRVDTPEVPADRAVTTIIDVSARRYYQLDRGRWRLHPLRPLPFGGRPFMKLRRADVVDVPREDARVSMVSAIDSRLTFFETAGGSGRSRVIFCPELNMLPVWVEFPDGRRRETIRVWLGEPTIPFGPPDGATVEIREEPAGPGPIDALPSDRRRKAPGAP